MQQQLREWPGIKFKDSEWTIQADWTFFSGPRCAAPLPAKQVHSDIPRSETSGEENGRSNNPPSFPLILLVPSSLSKDTETDSIAKYPKLPIVPPDMCFENISLSSDSQVKY